MSKSVRLVIGLITLALVVWLGTQPSNFYVGLSSLLWEWIVVAFIVVNIDRLLMAWKWRLLLPLEGRPSVLRATQIYCSSALWGLFLPATLGADAIRIGLTGQEGARLEAVTASVIVERLFGVVASFCVGLVATVVCVIYFPDNHPLVLLAIGFIAGLATFIGIIALMVNGRLFNWVLTKLPARWRQSSVILIVVKIEAALRGYREKPGLILAFFIASIVETLLTGIFFQCLFLSLQISVAFALVLMGVNVAMLAARIPISLAGLGVFEGGLAITLVRFGVAVESSVLASLISRVVQILVWLPWCGWYLLSQPAPSRAITDLGDSTKVKSANSV